MEALDSEKYKVDAKKEKHSFQYVVGVRCFTYNHSAYIEKALSGFVMQETNFPVVFIVVDDASTDKEPEVLRKWVDNNLQKTWENDIWQEEEYGKIAVAPLKEKTHFTFVVLLLNENHYQTGRSFKRFDYFNKWYKASKYQALCEGDDYWIDPFKLQRQCDYLETHQDCSMVFHNAFQINESDKFRSAKLFNSLYIEQDISMYEAINKWLVPTASMMFRNGYEFAPSWLPPIYSGDLTMILLFLNRGVVHYLNQISSVYLLCTRSDSHSMSAKMNGVFIMKQHVKLFSDFNEGTNYKYNDVILPRIKYLNKEIAFHEAIKQRKYWRLIPMLPFVIKKIKSRNKNNN